MDLADLALDLSAAASERGVGVLLLVDELQDLALEELAAICRACHEAGQRGSHFYVVGAGLPSLPGLLAEARSYAERLFDYWPIGALDEQAATDALVRPANAVGVKWEQGAVKLLIERSAGYPYFLQEFGKATWDCAPQQAIRLEDAQCGVEQGTLSLDRGFFISRWERATPAERDYMRAMARDGGANSHSGAVARRLGKALSAVGPVRAKLIHKGLIYAPEHGVVAFTVPGMAAFIARQPEG